MFVKEYVVDYRKFIIFSFAYLKIMCSFAISKL